MGSCIGQIESKRAKFKPNGEQKQLPSQSVDSSKSLLNSKVHSKIDQEDINPNNRRQHSKDSANRLSNETPQKQTCALEEYFRITCLGTSDKVQCDRNEEEEDDLLEMLESQNLRSSIIRLGSKKQKEPSTLNQKQILTSAQAAQKLEGRIIEQEYFSHIQIYSDKVLMEFALPKCRAGPIVIPYINYAQYSL